jgi:hypothetical protein
VFEEGGKEGCNDELYLTEGGAKMCWRDLTL